MRCNVGATPATKTTTSSHSATDRYLAAAQIFSWIVAQQGIAGARAVIAGNPSAMWNGKRAATFKVTLADGGVESHVVAPGLAPTLIIDSALPPPPTGDGIARPCPPAPVG